MKKFNALAMVVAVLVCLLSAKSFAQLYNLDSALMVKEYMAKGFTKDETIGLVSEVKELAEELIKGYMHQGYSKSAAIKIVEEDFNFNEFLNALFEEAAEKAAYQKARTTLAWQKGVFSNPFVDPRDKKTYETVKIGDQTWMAQNLDYHGEDGYLGLCYGDEPKKKIKKPENCKIFGRLYDWNEAMKACPEGWHLPSQKEWQTLVDFAGGGKVAGKKLKAKAIWTEYDFTKNSPKCGTGGTSSIGNVGGTPSTPRCRWTRECTDDRGRVTVTNYNECTTDEYGFSALPGGEGADNRYRGLWNLGNWWSSDREYAFILGYN